MLELHLSELFQVVDFFVIAEATTTFQGKRKSFHLQSEIAKNPSRWGRFLSKLRIVSVDDMPSQCSSKDAWPCEYHQRNSLLRGMPDLRDKDIVIVSDVDEILRPSVVNWLQNCDIPLPVQMNTSFYYYSLRWKKQMSWGHPIVASGHQIQNLSVQGIRQNIVKKGGEWERLSVSQVSQAGWHFSYFMTTDEIIQKLHSFSHVEYRQGKWDDAVRIKNAVLNGMDLLERKEASEKLTYQKEMEDIPFHLTTLSKDSTMWKRFFISF
eukprot:g4795.t1